AVTVVRHRRSSGSVLPGLAVNAARELRPKPAGNAGFPRCQPRRPSMHRVPPFVPLVPFLLLLSACAQPVLYPNDHLRKVGEATAQEDVRACMSMADNAGADRHGWLARDTAGGAAVGAAAGAAGG